MSLVGEVSSCDRLMVEGSLQVTLQKCQHVIIAETGVFNGDASTENADVHGRFAGELVVRKRLLIRAGGHVSGTITYGEIEIEAGGVISGTVEKAGAANVASSLLPLIAQYRKSDRLFEATRVSDAIDCARAMSRQALGAELAGAIPNQRTRCAATSAAALDPPIEFVLGLR